MRCGCLGLRGMHSMARRRARRGACVLCSVGFERGIRANGMDGAGRSPEMEDRMGWKR